jgi:hypothetical protein
MNKWIFLSNPITAADNRITFKIRSGLRLTVALLNKVVECVPITSVREFVIVRWKLLQTLHCDSAEVSRKRCILCQHCRAPGDEAVDQRLISHLSNFGASKPAICQLRLSSTIHSCLSMPRSSDKPMQRIARQSPAHKYHEKRKPQPWTILSVCQSHFIPSSYPIRSKTICNRN